MAIKTMSMSDGNGLYAEGWHELEISKASWTDWKEDKVLDVWFSGYPDSFKIRVFPAYSKENNEEFSIARFFKVANAGIIAILKDTSGKNPVLQYDDDTGNLTNKRINVLLHKEQGTDGKEYSSAFNRVAPVQSEEKPSSGEGDFMLLKYTHDDVSFWKKNVESGLKKYLENKKPSGDAVPF